MPIEYLPLSLDDSVDPINHYQESTITRYATIEDAIFRRRGLCSYNEGFGTAPFEEVTILSRNMYRIRCVETPEVTKAKPISVFEP